MSKGSKQRPGQGYDEGYDRIFLACPDAIKMREFACSNRKQCWEPCGELGHSAEHCVRVEDLMKEKKE